MSKITATQLVECFRRYCAEKWGFYPKPKNKTREKEGADNEN